MSILDQFFVYHPEPWQDRDWAWLSGLPLEDVWFQAVDGHRALYALGELGVSTRIQSSRP